MDGSWTVEDGTEDEELTEPSSEATALGRRYGCVGGADLARFEREREKDGDGMHRTEAKVDAERDRKGAGVEINAT